MEKWYEKVIFAQSSLDSRVFNGSAGKVSIESPQIVLDNSEIGTSNLGIGTAGDIKINANDIFSASNGSVITSNLGQVDGTPAEGKVGIITITAKNVSFSGGSQLQAGFFSNSQGEPGIVSIVATDSISFDDSSSIFTSVDPGAIADGGDIKLEANSISFTNSSGLTASIAGIGNSGNIAIDADSLTLDKGSRILASNTPSQTLTTNLTGGDTNLSISDQLILRNNSQITALANQNANGGNVTINANDGLIVAFPNQNNDITASAVEGKGGEINIFTQGIFGLEERLSTPPNQTNDIDASSEFGLQGTFSLNTPDFDPTTGLINLPASVGDASDQISQNPCEQGVGSEFIITGKGGLPPNVNESLNSESAQVGLIEAVPTQQQTVGANDIRPNRSATPEAVPAQGWVFNDNGEVTLTAYSVSGNKIQRSEQQHSNTCSGGIEP